MVHTIAVLLTLFPGFGAGYLLLRRFRRFVVHFLFSAILGSFVAIPLNFTRPRYEPDILTGVAVFLLPLLVWNIYHAHRLWQEVTPEDSGSLADQEGFSRKLAPIGLIVMLVLSVVLGILVIPSTIPEERPQSAGELRLEEVLTKLEQHELVQKALLYNRDAESIYYWYDVEPGGYTLELYLLPKLGLTEIKSSARRIQRYTDHLVYAEGFEVYVLHTQDKNALNRLTVDLKEHRPDDCEYEEEYGVCGYEPP